MAAEKAGRTALVTFSRAVRQALKAKAPMVGLESALITHGLPYPKNAEVARRLEVEVIGAGAVPATIAVLDGKVHVGLENAQLESLAAPGSKLKVSRRDIADAIRTGACGGTTVAATAWLAARQGIKVFATGGIGGVHREEPTDVSADLTTLADTPVIVVCAGAKAILNLAATLEYLETAGVPVLGYRTSEFPAFYSRESGLPVSGRVESPEEIAEHWRIQRTLGLTSALLIVNPIPEAASIPAADIAPIIEQASNEAKVRGIHGQEVTPFLLGRVSDLSAQQSIRANEALLLNNARLAGKIAVALKKSNHSRRH